MTQEQEMPYDEMWTADGTVRPAYANLEQWLGQTDPELFRKKREEAEFMFRRLGITFAVYGEGGDPERLIPYDIVPRVLSGAKWREMAEGMEQRVGDQRFPGGCLCRAGDREGRHCSRRDHYGQRCLSARDAGREAARRRSCTYRGRGYGLRRR